MVSRNRFLTGTLWIGALLVLITCTQEIERESGTTPTPAPATVTATPVPTSTLPSTPASTFTVPTPTPIPTTTPQPIVTPGPTPTPAVVGELPTGLFLKITSLPKESVVRTGTVPISGITNPDALVSVNGVLVDVDGEGRFTSTVSLLEEPNVIEVVASDFQGNKVSAVLTIIYIP